MYVCACVPIIFKVVPKRTQTGLLSTKVMVTMVHGVIRHVSYVQYIIVSTIVNPHLVGFQELQYSC